MSEPVYKARSAEDSHIVVDPARFFADEPDDEPDDVVAPRSPRGDIEADRFFYGFRPARDPDGFETLGQIPLTYEDTLSPQEGDRLAEDPIHRRITENVAGILERRYEDQPAVVVWSNLKIDAKVPDLTDGPAPDICVVEGVRDRERWRGSFRFGKESGRVRVAVEVVSRSSKKKDHEGILPIYEELGVEEYVALRAEGNYIDEVFEIRAWRRDSKTGKLVEQELDAEGRFHSRITGFLFGTESEGRGLVIWDASSGERQRPPKEETSWQTARADLEAEERRQAEARAEREAEDRRQAEARAEQAEAEIERLQALLRDAAGDVEAT